MTKFQSDRDLNRREFLHRSAIAGGLALAGNLVGCRVNDRAGGNADRSVSIVFNAADPVAATPPAQWAIGELAAALAKRGIQSDQFNKIPHSPARVILIVVGGAAASKWKDSWNVSGLSVPDEAESFAIRAANREAIQISGRDALGLVYALTELADVVRYAPDPLEALRSIKSISERPRNRIRGVMRLFVSDVEDKPWFYDRAFWQRYLTMLVTQRFNRFNLALGLGYDGFRNVRDTYFFFAYPFLVSPPGYNVRVVGLSDKERDRNLDTLRFISDQAAARGLHFQLGLWTHAFKWVDSPDANYVIDGLDDDHHAAYCRDALQNILQQCPNISGVTFRIHGESGITEGSYDFWKTVFDGVVRTGRPIEIDMHAKGMDQPMIDVALATGLPIKISPKFWAEHLGLPYHQASIRETEMPPSRPVGGQFSLSTGSRSFLRYGYGDLLKSDRRYGVLTRIWPGTQRLLLWGDPKFAAEYGRVFNFCGANGVEIFDPLSFKGRQGSGLPGGRDAYADESLKPDHDWEKYFLTYRLFGRLTYNPDTEAQAWQRQLDHDLGPAATPLESALANSSRILPLITTAHDPSAANANYWPEMYTNMSIVDSSHPQPYTDTPSPKVFGNVSPLDPQLFATINEYAASLLADQPIAKISPLRVAQQLEDWADAAFTELSKIPPSLTAAASRLSIDCAIAAGLGTFFAWKFRAAVFFFIFDQTGALQARQEASSAYRRARAAWARLTKHAQGVYVPDITFGPAPQQRGNWNDRLAAIDHDITAMEKFQRRTTSASQSTSAIAELIAHVLPQPQPAAISVQHTPPPSFRPGQAITIAVNVPQTVVSIRLWLRHVDQSERFSSQEMQRDDSSFTTTIPAEFTRSPFPIQYYFELRDAAGSPQVHPTFTTDFCGQPYYVLQ